MISPNVFKLEWLVMNTARYILIFHIMYYHLIFRHSFEKTQLTVHKNMGCTLLNDYHHLTWYPFDLFFLEICTFLLYTYLSRHILIMMKPYLDAKFPGKSLCGTFSTIWCYEWWMVYGKWWQEFEKRTTYYYSIVAIVKWVRFLYKVPRNSSNILNRTYSIILGTCLFQIQLVNTIIFLVLKSYQIPNYLIHYFFNLCSPLCVYARYICTNLIVYFVNKREDFLWKAPKWENEIYLKEMERPISLRLCKVYYSMAGRRNQPLLTSNSDM